MTPTTSPLLRTVDDMMLDARETEPALRATLLSLGSFAAMPVPEPRAELAALLSGGTNQLAHHRRHRRRRAAAVGVAVIAGMGLGVTGVAATASPPRLGASLSIQHLLQDWSPSWNIMGGPSTRGAADPTTGEPAVETSPDTAAPARQETPTPGSAGTAPTGAGTAAPDNAARGAGAGRGATDRGAVSPGKPAADAGALRNAAGATAGGPASPDGAAKGKQTPQRSSGDGPAGADPAADLTHELAKTGKLTLDEASAAGDLASGLLAPGPDDETGAGKAGPGSIWLKKFSR